MKLWYIVLLGVKQVINVLFAISRRKYDSTTDYLKPQFCKVHYQFSHPKARQCCNMDLGRLGLNCNCCNTLDPHLNSCYL